MLTLICSVSDHFHFVLAMPSKLIWPQEFTQTFVLTTFRAQRAKFDNISCPKGEILPGRFLIAGSWERVLWHVQRCPRCFLNQYTTIRLEKTVQHWENTGKFRFATNWQSPTSFQDSYFPCSLDSVLQILNRGREQAFETIPGASPRQSRSWTSMPLRYSWKGCPAIVASSGGLWNPTPWAFCSAFDV